MSAYDIAYRHQFGDAPIVRGDDRRILVQDDTQDPPVLLVWSPTAGDWVAANQSSSATNLSATPSPTGVVIASDTGTDATIPAADGTNAGLFLPAGFTKLAGIASGATANSSDAALLSRANHTGTQSADTLTDGTTNKAFLATERTKLAGVATGATANDTDANLKARANHTGTQSADTITDGSTNKAYTGTEQTKLAGVATGAQVNVLESVSGTAPVAVAAVSGKNQVISLPAATASQNGYATMAQIDKLDNIALGANVNVLEFVAGTAPIVVGAISLKGQTVSITAATTSAAGSMSAADKTKLDALGTDSGEISLPFNPSGQWTAFGAGGGACRYKKDATGRVHVTGLAKKSVALTANDVIAVLPSGYRPATVKRFACGSFAGFTLIAVDTSGNVYVEAGGSVTWTSVDGVSFDPTI